MFSFFIRFEIFIYLTIINNTKIYVTHLTPVHIYTTLQSNSKNTQYLKNNFTYKI